MQVNRTPSGARSLALRHADGVADLLLARRQDVALPAPTQCEREAAPMRAGLRGPWLARRALARMAIAHRLGIEPDAIEIAQDESGAPFVARPPCGLFLSLSGRGDMMAVAIADRPVGVDVEPANETFEPPLNVLHPAERETLANRDAASADMFLRLWTAKEAYLKALGMGLAREPSEVEIRLDADRVEISDAGVAVGVSAGYSLRIDHEGDGFVLACIVL